MNLDKEQIILFGASSGCQDTMEILKERGLLKNVAYICDNNKSKHYKELNGIMIYPPDKILENPKGIVIITSSYYDEIGKQLKGIGIQNKILVVPFIAVKPHAQEDYDVKVISDYIRKNEEKLRKLYNREDEYTQNLLELIIKERTRAFDFRPIEEYCGFQIEENYFVDLPSAKDKEITFVDVGAYNGDSFRGFYNIYREAVKRVYLIEPNHENCEMLRESMRGDQGYQSAVYECGTGGAEGELTFGKEDLAFCVTEDENGVTIPIKPLDGLDIQAEGRLYLKIVCEGSEMETLKGAVDIIKKHRPMLAISVFSNTEFILKVPEFVEALNLDYNFYLRSGVHTICYCIPKEVL